MYQLATTELKVDQKLMLIKHAVHTMKIQYAYSRKEIILMYQYAFMCKINIHLYGTVKK